MVIKTKTMYSESISTEKKIIVKCKWSIDTEIIELK